MSERCSQPHILGPNTHPDAAAEQARVDELPLPRPLLVEEGQSNAGKQRLGSGMVTESPGVARRGFSVT